MGTLEEGGIGAAPSEQAADPLARIGSIHGDWAVPGKLLAGAREWANGPDPWGMV